MKATRKATRPLALAPVLAVLALVSGCAALQEQLVADTYREGRTVRGRQVGLWTYYYKDPARSLRARGEYDNDRQNGPWTYWHESGEKSFEGGFVDKQLSGPATYWTPAGERFAQGFFESSDEHGLWRFYGTEGRVVERGGFTDARRSGRWRYYDADGDLRAEGYRIDDEPVGLWKLWGADGELVETTWPTPAGWDLVREESGEGLVTREGFLYQGEQEGLWVLYHPTGAPSLAGHFESGEPAGSWTAFDEEGEPEAWGEIRRGRLRGDWLVWDAGEPRRAEQDEAVPTITPRLTRMQRPPRESTWAASGGAPSAVPPDLAERLRTRPDVPIPSPPWTVDEEDRFAFLIERYGAGQAAEPERFQGRYSKPGQRKNDTAKSSPLLDRPLPVTLLKTGAGEDFDVGRFKGKQKVVVIVLRGYDGVVCVYCATQVAALEGWFDEFAARDTAVVVVYPGEQNDLEAFLRSYAALIEEEEPEIPFTMAYDPGFRLRDELDIQGRLAIPTTVILDEQGIVRFAYVGTSDDDRPSASDLLEAIDGM